MANTVLTNLLKEYEQKRIKAEIDADKRKEDLYNKIPELRDIENKINSCAISTTKNILNSKNESLEKLHNQIDELKKEKEKILKNNNINDDFFKPHYDCDICKDTGYVQDENYNTEMCNCLKQKLLNISFNKSNISNLDTQNFSTFNINLFSDEVNVDKYKFDVSPRDNIKQILSKSKEFVDNFEDKSYKNLLFTGNTGLR